MKVSIVIILTTWVIITACSAGQAEPTPAMVRLDPAALQPTPAWPTAELPPTPTRLPLPSPTPSPTPLNLASLLATPTPWPDPLVATPTFTSTATSTTTVAVEVLSVGLNIRQGPGVDYPVRRTAQKGDRFPITGVTAAKNWLQIRLPDGSAGWVSAQSSYVQILGSLDDVETLNVERSNVQPEIIPGPSSSVPGQASASSSQPAAVGGRLVFATRSGGDLYLINLDGAGLRKLAGGVVDPVVSPDGAQVAFSRWDGSKFGAVYILNLADGQERVVAGDIRQPKSPTWSPDGQELIISFQHGGVVDPKPECRKFDLDDGFQLPNISEITSQHHYADGSVKICFIRAEDLQWGLRRIKLSAGAFEDLPADLYSFNPTWDPHTPTRLIYDGERGLMQLDLLSGALKPFTTDVRDTAPVFSPDGQKLALTYKQHDHWEVYTYDLASGSRQRLTQPPLLADPQYNSAAPAWSPDGSQIAFVTDRTGQWEIWVMNSDGSSPHPLFGPEVQAQLDLEYRGVNERLLSWVR